MNNILFHENLLFVYDLSALDKTFFPTFLEKIEANPSLKATDLALHAETNNDIVDSGLDSIEVMNKLSICHTIDLRVTVKLTKKFRLKLSFLCVNKLHLFLSGHYVKDALKILSRRLSKKIYLDFCDGVHIDLVLPLFCIDIGDHERVIELPEFTSLRITKVAFKLILKTNKQVLKKRLLSVHGVLVDPPITRDQITFLKKYDLID